MHRLAVHLFGPPEVMIEGAPAAGLRSEKALALLSYLAVESDRAHRREKLAGLLWPGYTERSARANLRRALADLRRAMGAASPSGDTPAPYLLTTRQTIQFDTCSDAWVDVAAFCALLKPPLSSETPPSQLEQAIKLYRGAFLEGFSVADSAAFEEWTLLTRERLQRQALAGLHRLALTYQERGEYERALPHAWRQLELDPWREDAHRQVMRLLALSGQRAAALAQYESCRDILQAELNTEPSEQTQALYEMLRRGEWPPERPGPEQQPREVGPCPYRGLATFQEHDAPVFFGRGGFSGELKGAVREKPMVAVVGSSGSGKSSVVLAGLLPTLRHEEDWQIVVIRPGERPFYALAAGLLPLLDPGLSEADRLIEVQKLASILRDGSLDLATIVDRIRVKEAGRLFLVVDQFEELFTLCPAPALRRLFLDGLLAATSGLREGDPPRLSLLITLRADFMGQALAYRPLADALQGAILLLGPMTREELAAAIEEPALKQGAGLEPGLAERILGDVGNEPGNLPLLEFALTLLWEAQASGWLTHEAYGGLGQVEGALAQYAEQVFAELEPGEQDGARRIFVQLVQPGVGTEDTRRVATRAEAGEGSWPLVQHLAGKRLVVTDRDAGGIEVVEVAHEALIQHWSRLSEWMAADRAFRVWQEGLRAAMRQWDSSQRDEGALLRGGPLVQAEDWQEQRGSDLGPAEQEYIQASMALRARRAAEREAHRQEELASERRSRRRLGTLAGVLALVTVVAVALSLFALQQRRQAMEAYSLSLAANAREALEDLDTATGLALALAANGIESPPEKARRVLIEAAYAPGARWRADIEELFEGVQGPAASVEISPDGLTALVGLADGSISLLNLETREEIRRLDGHTGVVNDLAFGPDGRTALSGGDDAQVILWDLDSGEENRRLGGHTGSVRAVDIAPDGRTAVSGGFAGATMAAPGELILWDLETGGENSRLEGHAAGIVAVAYTPDGGAILASSGDAALFTDSLPSGGQELGQVLFDLLLWEVESGEVIRRFDIVDDDVFSLAISPDGSRALAASYYTNQSVLWDLQTGERLGGLEGHTEGVRTVAFAPGGNRAASGSDDDSLILWDVEAGQPVARLEVRASNVLDLAVSPDGRSAISTSQDSGLILWDLDEAELIQLLTGHDDMVYDVAITPDGALALSSSGSAAPSAPVQDASIRLWDLGASAQVHSSSLPVNVIFQVAISPDARTALVASDQPLLRIWDLETWQEVGWLEGHDGPVTGVEFAPDGQRAVSVSVDGTLILWDVPGRQVIRRWAGHGAGLWAVAISPDGRTALSDSGDSSMVLWDLDTGEEIQNLVRETVTNEAGSSGIAFLPDGRTAISCEQDGDLIEWDLESGTELRRLGSHPSLRTRVTITPDGLLAQSSGMDGTLRLWDLESGELVRQSSGHGVIFDLALSPDGASVLFGSSDQDITQWQVGNPGSEELAAWVEANRYVRELTCEERSTYRIEPLCSP